MKKTLAALLLVLPIAASAAEYMEKTPFQLSRAFSPGVITEGGKIVWVAGQTATRDNAGADIANNFEAQVKQVFSQVDAVLKRAGGSLANVVSMTVFIKESRYGDRFVEMRMRTLLLGLAMLAGCSVMPEVVAPDVVRDLAPTGTLHAAINYGNSVLAQREPSGSEGRGVSIDLARELARRLGVPLELVAYDAAGKVTGDAKSGRWDIAFVARDPERAKDIEFSPPYVIIEGGYVVPANSPLKTIEDVDREGLRISVSRGSAYDLYLSRVLKRAQLVRAPSPALRARLHRRDEGLGLRRGVA